jgi:predicted transcriptional regulator of viral defense system
MKEIFNTLQTVFDLKDLGKILWETNYNNLKSKVAYCVKNGYLKRIRRGVFVKNNFNPYELACKIFTPSYISFETVLLKEWIIYQADETIYVASYLSRSIECVLHEKTYHIVYRKLKDERLYDDTWIEKKDFYWIAWAQRAIQDMKYLKKDFYFDNIK